MISKETLTLAQTLWDYLHLGESVEKSDCILVLGSQDVRVAKRGAELYLKGFAPLIVFSGGFGAFTKGVWKRPEADRFAAIAKRLGVPDQAILVENRSTNTGENIGFTQKLLERRGLDPRSVLLVVKPYAERRGLATAIKHWPRKRIAATSPQIRFGDYPTRKMPIGKMIAVMVGEVRKIVTYPGKGYEIAQKIPKKVKIAYKKLVALGFVQYLKN
jgi:uncharacterized SAM-binding protein YcdF (DUF218 family)